MFWCKHAPKSAKPEQQDAPTDADLDALHDDLFPAPTFKFDREPVRRFARALLAKYAPAQDAKQARDTDCITPEMVDAGAEVLYGHPRASAQGWAKEDKFDSCANWAERVYRAMEIARAQRAEGERLQCWSCRKSYTPEQRSEADGHCPQCGVEMDDGGQRAEGMRDGN